MNDYTEYDNYSVEELTQKRSTLDEANSSELIAHLDLLIRSKQADINEKPNLQKPRIAKVIFHGKTSEYFAIWIVNVLLSILTLGIYSAWATVRNNRYFHSNTEIDGHRFRYLAKPMQILIGRIIAIVLFVAFSVLSSLNPVVGLVLLILLMVAAPWFICRSIRFNCRMITYRNIQFNFHGKYLKALLVFIVYPILSLFTLYLALPLAFKAMDKFLIDHTSYGDTRFHADIKASSYYKAAGLVLLASMALIGSFVGAAMFFTGQNFTGLMEPEVVGAGQSLLGLGYILTLVVSSAIYTKIIRNHLYNNTVLSQNNEQKVAQFKSQVELVPLVWIHFSNFFVLIITLGLALPWVKIRSTRFFANATEVAIYPAADKVVADLTKNGNAIGEELSNVFDMEVAIP